MKTKNNAALKEFIPFKMYGAKEKMGKLCYSAVHKKYGEDLHPLIKERLEKELEHIRCHDYESHYILAKKISDKCREIGALKIVSGCIGNSFVAFLLGICDVNPLPPHGYCCRCKNIEFFDKEKYESGFDLKGIQADEFLCFDCDNVLNFDGHNLPCEFFMGIDGSKTPDFGFFVEPEGCDEIVRFTNEILKNYVLKEISDGKYLIVPNTIEIRENTSDAVNYFDKIGIYPLPMLERLSALKFDGNDIKGLIVGHIAESEKVRKIIEKAELQKFSDFVKVYGLVYGRGTWEGNAEKLIENGCELKECIAFREDIMHMLLRYGIERKTSFDIAEMIRKGKGYALSEEKKVLMKENGIPQWCIESMQKIECLLPKAQAIEQVKLYIRLCDINIINQCEQALT